MFNLNSNPTESDMPLIVSNYKDLLFDEMPILFIGTNKYSNRIIGSLIAEDYDKKFTRFLHTIIDDSTYYDFISKKITYLELIISSNNRYIIDETFSGDKFVFSIKFEDIPEEYLPLEDSYCPEIEHIFSFSYGASLKGKLADEHKAEVSDVNLVQLKLEDILKSACSPLENLNLHPKSLLAPSTIGSFRINIQVEVQNNVGLFAVDSIKISRYLSSYLDYILLKLPIEDNNVLEFFPHTLEPIKDALSDIYEQSNVKIAVVTMEENILENVNETAKKVVDFNNSIHYSNSFDRIEIYNYDSDGYEYGIGKIDEGYIDSIKGKIIKEESMLSIVEEVTDAEPKEYRILIYKLSTETGKGMARIYKDGTENYDKAYLHIKSNLQISNTYYSKGFYEEKVITVKGKARKKNDTFRYLTIEI
jgi:hypothetical protein